MLNYQNKQLFRITVIGFKKEINKYFLLEGLLEWTLQIATFHNYEMLRIGSKVETLCQILLTQLVLSLFETRHRIGNKLC